MSVYRHSCLSGSGLVSLFSLLFSQANLPSEGHHSEEQASDVLGRVIAGGANPRWLNPSIVGQQEGGHPGNYRRNVVVTRDF